jgi:hypothetical protein
VLGRPFVELFLKDRLTGALNATADKLQAWGVGVAKFGGLLTAVGAAVTGPAVAAVAAFAEQGVELLRLSQVTGTTVEALSTLQFAFGKVGVEAESLNTALVHMQAFLSEAIQGGKSARETLTRLGLSIGVLKNVPSDEKLRLIADALAKIGDETQRVAAAREIFGRGGAELLPGLNRGAAGLRELEDEARRLGLVMTNETAKASFDLLKNMNALTSGLKGAWFLVSKELLPILLELTAPLKDVKTQIVLTGRAVANWVKDNRELVGAVLKAGFAIGAAGAALVVLGGALKVAGLALGAPIVGITALGIGMATVEGDTRTWGLALAALGVGLKLFGVNLLSPLGLTAALGTALVVMGDDTRLAGIAVLAGVAAIKLIPVACTVATAALAVLKFGMAALAVVTAGTTAAVSLLPFALAGAAVALVALVAVAGYAVAGFGGVSRGAADAGKTTAYLADTAAVATDGLSELTAAAKTAGQAVGALGGTKAGGLDNLAETVKDAAQALGLLNSPDKAGVAFDKYAADARDSFEKIAADATRAGRTTGQVIADGAGMAGRSFSRLSDTAAVAWAGIRAAAVDGFGGIKETAVASFAGIADAIKAGDLRLALDVALAGLNVAWLQGLQAMNVAWVEFRHGLSEGWDKTTDGIADTLVDVWHGGLIACINFAEAVISAFDKLTDPIRDIFINITEMIEKAWARATSLTAAGAAAAVSAVESRYQDIRNQEQVDREARAGQREQDARLGREQVVRDNRTARDALRAPRAGEQAQRDQARQQDVDAARQRTQPAIDAAQLGLDAANEAARKAREKKEQEIADQQNNRGPGPGSDFGKTSVAGTFSGAAVALLGGGGAAERTAKATEDTARGVERLTREVRNGGGFAVG